MCIKLDHHPRLRGEKQSHAQNTSAFSGSPPLTRGKVCRRDAGAADPGITPAYAGKRCICLSCHRRERDHPRLRGEKQQVFYPDAPAYGSPPLTRGKGSQCRRRMRLRRITPAYAGKSLWECYSHDIREDHPRLRGEKGLKVIERNQHKGSPPLTRGKAFQKLRPDDCLGITPAYAGKSHFRRARLDLVKDHPRLRGEKSPRTGWTTGR